MNVACNHGRIAHIILNVFSRYLIKSFVNSDQHQFENPPLIYKL